MTFEQFKARAWNNINSRVRNYHLPSNRCYTGIVVACTKAEFIDWCDKNREIWAAIDNPSIDRIDSSKDYALPNMRIIPLRDNIKAGSIAGGEADKQARAKITHCPKGHPYSVENTYVYRNSRRCRLCGNARRNRLYHKTVGVA